MSDWEQEGLEPGVVPTRGLRWYLRGLLHAGVTLFFFFLLAVAALPMGANRDWAWAPLCILLGFMAIPIAFGLGARGGHQVLDAERWPLLCLFLCFVLFAGFGLWQMSTIAPAAGDAWLFARAKEILGQAHAPTPAIATDLARNTLLKCLACALIFLMARAVCRSRVHARWLLIAVVASGVVVVAYGLAMQMSTHSCYVGSYLRKQGGYTPNDFCLMGGTFVNSNSFGCYVGLCLVAAAVLIFSRPSRPDESRREQDEVEGGFIDWLTGARIAQIASLLLLLGGLMFSGSRAAFAATVLGLLALGLLLMRGRWRSHSQAGRAFFAGFFVFVVVGLIAGGSMVTKFADSGDSLSRLRIWAVSLQAIGLSPWLGWGLGGFGDIFTILQPPTFLQINDIAHSTPLETVVEMGVVAAIPAIALVLLPWAICLRGALRRRGSHRYLPIAAFSVAAVPILHSSIDFSLQIPAIGFVTSGLLGMGWAQAFGRSDTSDAFTRPR